jgi:hypothetical protein
MAFWNRDGAEAQAQEVREEAGASAMSRDPDVRNAMRGIYTGKYADLAASFPAAWDAPTRNVQVARSIAQDKGINDSGVRWSGKEWQAANTGTPLAVQLAPYVIGGVAGGTALAGAGGGGGYGPLAGHYGAMTTEATVPSALTAGGGGGFGMGLNYTDLILGGTGKALDLYGQHKALGANADALDKSLEATRYASDTQAKSAAESLAFLRQQAAYDAQVAEVNRGGDYQQWAAKQELLGTVGQSLGLPARRIPAYVPLPAYSSGGTPPPAAPGAAGPASAAPAGYTNVQGQPLNADPAAMTAQIQETFQRRFGRPATDEEVRQGLHYGGKPDLYSDNQWRFGFNDYLAERIANQSASADPRLAGTAGIIAAPPGAAAAAAPRRYQTMAQPDPLGAVDQYLSTPVSTVGQLRMPTPRRPYGGAVGSYL